MTAGPTNSNFQTGPISRTKIQSLRPNFWWKLDCSHAGTWSPGPWVPETGPCHRSPRVWRPYSSLKIKHKRFVPRVIFLALTPLSAKKSTFRKLNYGGWRLRCLAFIQTLNFDNQSRNVWCRIVICFISSCVYVYQCKSPWHCSKTFFDHFSPGKNIMRCHRLMPNSTVTRVSDYNSPPVLVTNSLLYSRSVRLPWFDCEKQNRNDRNIF